MEGKWFGFSLVFLLGNLFMWFLSGPQYTAWDIRNRNKMKFFFFRWQGFLDRADEADETAEEIARWQRPLVLLAFNGFMVYLAVVTYRMP